MNRAAVLAFGIPLLFTIALTVTREWRDEAVPARSPALPDIPAAPTTVSPGNHQPEPGNVRVRAGSISGLPRIIDGDTIELAGVKIRLNGIDAPEAAQTCGSVAQLYSCGGRATEALRSLLANRVTVCKPSGSDRYGRTLATCFVGDQDINQWLVLMGYAVAYRRYSLVYVAAETAAKVARRGLWADGFEMPWDYRERVRRLQSAGAPD